MTDAELIAFRNLFQECQCLRDKMQMEKRVGPQYIAAWEQAVSDASEAFEAIALAQPTPEGAWHPCTELPKCYAGDRVVVYIDDEKRSHTDTKPTPELFILEATEGGWAAVDNTYGGYEPSWGRAWAYERDLFPSATTLAELAKEVHRVD